MAAEIIDGRAIAEEIRAELREEINRLAARGVTPCVATVLAADDHGARVYRRQIERAALDLGLGYRDVTVPEGAGPAGMLDALGTLAADESVHGILPLRPFAGGIPEGAVFDALHPGKDIDGLHPVNAGRLALGQPVLPPATPRACFEVIERFFAWRGRSPRDVFEGKDLVIVGRSASVGRPAYFMALQRNATPTTVHSLTSKAGRLADHTRRADILIVAMGRAGFITADMVRPGAVVVDVGINSVPALDEHGHPVLDEAGRPRYRTVGDVAFDQVRGIAGALTPVPGGVGAVTNVLLMQNVVRAAARLAG